MKESELRKLIVEEIKNTLNEAGVQSWVSNARDLQKAISRTKHNPSSMEIQVLVGNKTLKVYGVTEEDGALKLYAK